MVTPDRQAKVGDVLTFEATVEPVTLPVQFTFNHGNGTVDARKVSVGVYRAAGVYPVTLAWSLFGSSGTVSCGSVTITGVGSADFQPGDYVGLSEAGAQARANERGFATTRTVRIDDEVFVGTADFRTDRLNLEIDDGLVTSASIG